jgi:hypothetical protein
MKISSSNKKGLYVAMIKGFIFKMFPYLRGVKPNSYVVLTEKIEEQLSIFT